MLLLSTARLAKAQKDGRATSVRAAANLAERDSHVKFMRRSLSSSSFLQPRPPTQIIVLAARLSSRHPGAGDSDGPVESDIPLLKPSLRG
jgi:hypothetical protein